MRPRRLYLLALAALAAALAACVALPEGERLVHWEQSAFQTLVVTDSATRRCLRFGPPLSANDQSCQAHSAPQRLLLRSTRALASVLLLWEPAPRRVLLIGVGGGSLATALTAVRADLSIDAVDIDPAVLRVAQEYFGLAAGPRLRLHAADGVAFAAAARARGERYDAILLDAFDEAGVPEPLFAPAFLADLRALLADDGVFVANTFADAAAATREERHAQAAFGPVLELRFADASGNRVLVAAARPAALPDPAALLEGADRHGDALDAVGVETGWLRATLRVRRL